MPTTINPTPSPDRLLPYAKDHDRLQLALLYIEAESNRYTDNEAHLESLRRDEETVRRSLKKLAETRESRIKDYIHERHPAKYIDSNGHEVVPDDDDLDNPTTKTKEELKEWRDPLMDYVFTTEKCETRVLTHTLEKIKAVEAEQRILSERIAQKDEIMKLIEELRATAFDGDTPEFPHEDHLEALVGVAEIGLKGEQAALDKLDQENGLAELKKVGNSVEDGLANLRCMAHEIYATVTAERPIAPGIFLLKEFWKLQIPDDCKAVAQQCQEWKEMVDKYFSEHPNTMLSSLAREKIPQLDPKELMEIFSRATSTDASVRSAHKERIDTLFDDVRQAASEIRGTVSAVRVCKIFAEDSIERANTVLELRQRQLASARSQILDHVIDPEKCPLEQPADELPEYPEQILVHELPASHPAVSQIFAESETYPVHAYVEDILESRLSRARRTTHPPVLLPGRYQPPAYDVLEDPDRLRSHFRREVPPVEGEAPEYAEELDYGDVITMEPSEIIPIVGEELNEIASNARQQLGLKSKAQIHQFNAMMETVMNLLEGRGNPFD
ncbi:hypothetical protein OPQ81_002250 [Rhizoctonia solani]|nr:hypothetical protein OPQ81_002250 [Rhizoctonia solani]